MLIIVQELQDQGGETVPAAMISVTQGGEGEQGDLVCLNKIENGIPAAAITPEGIPLRHRLIC